MLVCVNTAIVLVKDRKPRQKLIIRNQDSDGL